MAKEKSLKAETFGMFNILFNDAKGKYIQLIVGLF